MEVEVGQIVGTHGIKGEVKIKSYTDFADERFAPGQTLRLELKKHSFEFEIESHRVHKNMDLVKFVGLDNINDVEKFRDAVVYANKDDDLEDGEYYYSDIIGCQVEDEMGHHLGEVIHILEMPTQDILEIEDENGKTFMVPYVDAFVIEEDYENDRLVIRLIEGMR